MDRYYRCYKRIFIFMGVCAVALYALPVMSVCLNDGENCTLLVRGYNLMEFSAWGCVPLFAQFLIPMILFDWQIKTERGARLVFLFAGNMICYVHSLNAARTWLNTLGGSLVTYHPGVFLCPVAFAITLMLPKILEDAMYRKYLMFAEPTGDSCVSDEESDDMPFSCGAKRRIL